ncbi:hypothetical protein TNCV_3803701 [Trichonephila clavipes]|nr:hypothetical protein TNCV_3803701 [Trichonephila clavipes]
MRYLSPIESKLKLHSPLSGQVVKSIVRQLVIVGPSAGVKKEKSSPQIKEKNSMKGWATNSIREERKSSDLDRDRMTIRDESIYNKAVEKKNADQYEKDPFHQFSTLLFLKRSSRWQQIKHEFITVIRRTTQRVD